MLAAARISTESIPRPRDLSNYHSTKLADDLRNYLKTLIVGSGFPRNIKQFKNDDATQKFQNHSKKPEKVPYLLTYPLAQHKHQLHSDFAYINDDTALFFLDSCYHLQE